MSALMGLQPLGRDACVRLLLGQVRAIQRAHRAGITPHYGQLEDLFDTADVVERQLEAATTVKATVCSTPECGKAPIGGESPYAAMCLDCAGKAVVAVLVRGSVKP